jgi:hypothetical protein
MHAMTDDERMGRWTEPRFRQATDLTDRDIIFWDGQWTEILGVYRDMDEWEQHFGAARPDLPQSSWDEDRMFAENALDWSSSMYVVLRLLDRPNSNPGEIADKFVKVYQYEPVKTQSQPAWQPSAADQAPLTANAVSVQKLRAALREFTPGHYPRALVDHLLDALDAQGRADRDDQDAFTEGLLAGVKRNSAGFPAGQLGQLAYAMMRTTGTDADTAAWLAARVFGTLEAMRVESGAYRAPGEGEPWDVKAWLATLNREG